MSCYITTIVTCCEIQKIAYTINSSHMHPLESDCNKLYKGETFMVWNSSNPQCANMHSGYKTTPLMSVFTVASLDRTYLSELPVQRSISLGWNSTVLMPAVWSRRSVSSFPAVRSQICAQQFTHRSITHSIYRSVDNSLHIDQSHTAYTDLWTTVYTLINHTQHIQICV